MLILHNNSTRNLFVWYPKDNTFKHNNTVASFLRVQYDAIVMDFDDLKTVNYARNFLRKQTFDPTNGQEIRDLLISNLPELFI